MRPSYELSCMMYCYLFAVCAGMRATTDERGSRGRDELRVERSALGGALLLVLRRLVGERWVDVAGGSKEETTHGAHAFLCIRHLC